MPLFTASLFQLLNTLRIGDQIPLTCHSILCLAMGNPKGPRKVERAEFDGESPFGF